MRSNLLLARRVRLIYVFFAVALPSGAAGRLSSNNPDEKENPSCVLPVVKLITLSG